MFPSYTSVPIALIGFLLTWASAEEREVSLPLGSGVDLKLIRVEPGTFTQGSPNTEQNRTADETQREVTLTRGFYLGKFPVTRGQFEQFAKETGFRTEAEKGTSGGFGWDGSKLIQRRDFTWRNPGFPQTPSDPVVLVTWNDAKAFLGWLSRKTGAQSDLPSEAQWEYACRAGTTTAFWSGDDINQAAEIAWHQGNANARTHPVGEKGENPWGFADMNGNVWEWCVDWFGPYPAGPATDPVQTNSSLSDKPRRVLRGGSWLKDLSTCRSAARYRNDPQSRNADNGFRVMAFELRPPSAIERTAPPAALPQPSSQPPAVALERQNEAPRHVSQPPGAVPSRAIESGNMNRLVSSFGGLCCLLGAGAIVLFVARWIFKRGGASSPAKPIIPPGIPGLGGVTGSVARRAGTFRTRMGDDGFWIDAEGVAPGTLLTCRYSAGGASQQIDVRYQPQPGGQFIYTGARPTTVSVVMAGAAASSFMSSQPMVDFDDDERRREAERRQLQEDEERRRRRRNDPPAY